MSHYANQRSFNSAQAKYDAMTPDEGGPCECGECNGKGYRDCWSDECGGWREPCEFCNDGKVDEDGNPWIEPEDDPDRGRDDMQDRSY